MKNLFSTFGKQGHLDAVNRQDATLAAEIAEASRVSWLPIEINMRMVDALMGAYGEKRGMQILVESLHAQFDTPLWNNFIKGGLRLFGQEPIGFGRWIPEACALIFRNCGSWSIELGEPAQMRAIMQEVPQPLIDDERWMRTIGNGMLALFWVCEVDGGARMIECDPHARRATFLLEWKTDVER